MSCAHRLRDPRSCSMCLKCAPSYRKWLPTPLHLQWWFLLASCQWACNLRWTTRSWPHGTRVIVPLVLVHELRNRAMPPMHVQASQNCPRRHDTWILVSEHLSLGVARRRHPTAYAVHCRAGNKTSVHRDLCHWCNEIHLQDLPNLARASTLRWHEQFPLELVIVRVTEDNSDQRHTTS